MKNTAAGKSMGEQSSKKWEITPFERWLYIQEKRQYELPGRLEPFLLAAHIPTAD